MTYNEGNRNTAYLALHDIPFWKWQTKGNGKVPSAADLGYLQKWPLMEAIQKMHIYPNMIYLSGGWVTTKPNQTK